MLMVGAWYSELPKEVIEDVDVLIEHGLLHTHCKTCDIFVGSELTEGTIIDDEWLAHYDGISDYLREIFKIEPVIHGYS